MSDFGAGVQTEAAPHPGMAVADDTAPADQDESWHPCACVDQSESFVLDVLACGIQVFGDVVPPRADLVHWMPIESASATRKSAT